MCSSDLSKLFNGDFVPQPNNGVSSLIRACTDRDLQNRCRFLKGPHLHPPSGHRMEETGVLLETDASVKEDRRSACGGVLRDNSNNWLGGFMCKLTAIPVSIAEIIGIIHGLNLCWSRGYRQVLVHTDSMEAISLLTWGCGNSHPFKDVIEEGRLILTKTWQVTLAHKPREEILLADHLAKIGRAHV